MSRAAWVGVFGAVVALGAGIGVVVAATGGGVGSTTTAPRQQATSAGVPGSFALPLARNAQVLTLAQHRRDVLVGIAARRGGPIEVVAVRAETPVPVLVTLNGHPARTQPCGSACSRVDAPALAGSKELLSVRAGSDSFSFSLPTRMPPSGAAAFAHASKTMAALRSYHYTERLSSGGPTVFTRLDVQAPDRLRFRTAGGRSVIIGRTRWDFLAGRWERASFPGLAIRELLMWYHARSPRIVARRPNGTVELAAFGFLPVPAWFRLTVEPSGRVSEAEMMAASHFMLHRYSAFDRGVAIRPPR